MSEIDTHEVKIEGLHITSDLLKYFGACRTPDYLTGEEKLTLETVAEHLVNHKIETRWLIHELCRRVFEDEDILYRQLKTSLEQWKQEIATNLAKITAFRSEIISDKHKLLIFNIIEGLHYRYALSPSSIEWLNTLRYDAVVYRRGSCYPYYSKFLDVFGGMGTFYGYPDARHSMVDLCLGLKTCQRLFQRRKYETTNITTFSNIFGIRKTIEILGGYLKTVELIFEEGLTIKVPKPRIATQDLPTLLEAQGITTIPQERVENFIASL